MHVKHEGSVPSFSRKAQRIVHVIFNKPDTTTTHNQVELEDSIVRMRIDLSAAVSCIIKMGKVLVSEDTRMYNSRYTYAIYQKTSLVCIIEQENATLWWY